MGDEVEKLADIVCFRKFHLMSDQERLQELLGRLLRIEADGVRNLGAMAFDQASPVSRGLMGTSETVLPGAVYLVETRRGAVLVRVMDIRGLNSIRAAAPAAMNRPRLSDLDGPQAPAPQNNITLVLEWRALSQ